MIRIENFENPRADGSLFENGFSLYLNRKSSNVDEIWYVLYADASFEFEIGHVRNSQNFPNPIWQIDAILRIVLRLYLSDILGHFIFR